MRHHNHCRAAASAATALALIFLTGGSAIAADVSLGDHSYKAYRRDGNAVVIDTSGLAKLRVAFVSPDTARIEIAPNGTFVKNPSPAVAVLPASMADIEVRDNKAELIVATPSMSLHIDKAHLRVDAYDAAGKALTLESPAEGTHWDNETGAIRQTRLLAPGEHIFGLGQDNANHGTLDRRGTIRDLWTGQQINSGNVTANYPVPFYLSTGPDGRGYGVFVDNVWHMRFDIGKTQADRLTWTAPGGPIDYYIIAGPSFKKVIEQYTGLTGRPSMLPLYAFGYWQSRCFFADFPDIRNTVDHLKKSGIPLDVLVIDSNWPNVDVDFKWSADYLKGRKPEDWMAGLHADGAHIMVSTKGPMIRKDASTFPEALKLGLFATDGHGKTLTTGYYGGELMDFTHPGMEPWLATKLAPLSQQGTDAWWLDLIEPEGEPPQATYYAGKSADIHNTFPLLNFKAYYDYERAAHPDKRPVILGRAASAGTQRYSGIVWTGDINSDWPTFRAHIPEAQNTGLSGLPYWTNDSGGFLPGFLDNDRYGAHAELYERWFEFTTFAPIMRTHKAGPSEPYEFGPEVEATAKKYAHLRYRLLPYIYTAAHQTATTGIPMLRPLILEYQNDPQAVTAKTEFLFGPDLLVAPIIWANTHARQVYFPAGRWISYDDGFEVGGGQSIGVGAPRDRIPLFVRAGAILPTAPDMMYSGEKPWDPVTLDIWPAGVSTDSLYEDDNGSTAYLRGESTTTVFRSVETPGRSVEFTITPSNAKFGPQRWIARFHLTSIATAVSVDGKAVPLQFDTASATLTVDVPGGRIAHRVNVTLDGSIHARPVAPHVEAPAVEDIVEAVPAKQIPQFLPAPVLPVRIDPANYDKGGEGLAFHVATPAKDSIYRQDGVPITASTDAGGGYVIRALAQGDWLSYTLDAGHGGWFALSARTRAEQPGSLELLHDRAIRLTTLAVPASGAAWATTPGSQAFYLPSGQQILTLKVVRPGFDLGALDFTKLPAAAATVEAEKGRLVNIGTNNDHPGFSGDGFVAGMNDQAQSVTVQLDVPKAGQYLVALRYANGAGDAEATVRGQVVALHPTDGWDRYEEAGQVMTLPAGTQTFVITGNGKGIFNLDRVSIVPLPDAVR